MSQPNAHGPHDDTIKRANANADEIGSKFAKQKALRSLLDQGMVMIDFVRDFASGRYREIPYWAASAAALALVYVLSPVDLVPDFIIGAGFLDDAAVVAFCLRLIEKELDRYKEWKAKQANDPAMAKTAKVPVPGKILDV